MKIFARFKELCPKHSADFDPFLSNYYKRMVALQEKNSDLKSTAYDPHRKQLKETYETICRSREIKTIADIPDYIRQKLRIIIEDVVAEYGPNSVDLVGSYVSGRYNDENSSEEFKMLRALVDKGDHISDFDLVTDTRKISGKRQIGNLTYELVSQGQHHDRISPPLRIYDGKPLI